MTCRSRRTCRTLYWTFTFVILKYTLTTYTASDCTSTHTVILLLFCKTLASLHCHRYSHVQMIILLQCHSVTSSHKHIILSISHSNIKLVPSLVQILHSAISRGKNLSVSCIFRQVQLQDKIVLCSLWTTGALCHLTSTSSYWGCHHTIIAIPCSKQSGFLKPKMPRWSMASNLYSNLDFSTCIYTYIVALHSPYDTINLVTSITWYSSIETIPRNKQPK